MYDTTYEFAVDAKSAITGQWRGWSESTTISTLSADAVTATEVSIDPACDGGVTLNGMSGVVSKSLGRAVTSSTCTWRLSPTAASTTAAAASGTNASNQMLFVSFEPSVDAAAEVSTSSLFSVGETLFSPLRSQDVTPYIGGVTKVVVTNGGLCTDSSGSSTSIHGQLPVIFTGASGVTANAYINSGVVESVYLVSYSSTQIPLTTAITATIGQDAQGMPGVSCNGVELEVVNGGLSYFTVNRQGQGYTSAPEVTLSGGAGDNRFEPAQVYAVANDVNQPNNFEVRFRTVCATRQGTGGTSDQCICSEASGGFYSSVPTVTFSGGLADYISFSGLGSASSDLASSSLMPRAGTVQADQASLLPYLSAMLPIPAAVTLEHSGSLDSHFQMRYQVVDLPAPGPVGQLRSSSAAATTISLSWDAAVGMCRNATHSRRGTLADVQRSVGPSYGTRSTPESFAFSRHEHYQRWQNYANDFAPSPPQSFSGYSYGSFSGGGGGSGSGAYSYGGGGTGLTAVQQLALNQFYTDAINQGASPTQAQVGMAAMEASLRAGKTLPEATLDGIAAGMGTAPTGSGGSSPTGPGGTAPAGSGIRRQLKTRPPQDPASLPPSPMGSGSTYGGYAYGGMEPSPPPSPSPLPTASPAPSPPMPSPSPAPLPPAPVGAAPSPSPSPAPLPPGPMGAPVSGAAPPSPPPYPPGVLRLRIYSDAAKTSMFSTLWDTTEALPLRLNTPSGCSSISGATGPAYGYAGDCNPSTGWLDWRFYGDTSCTALIFSSRGGPSAVSLVRGSFPVASGATFSPHFDGSNHYVLTCSPRSSSSPPAPSPSPMPSPSPLPSPSPPVLSPSPTPPLPPVPVQHEVVVSMTVSGVVSDYSPGSANAQSIRQALASEAKVDVSAVSLSVTAASVLIEATITVASSGQGTAAKTDLASALSSKAAATALLGVTVQSAPSVVARTVILVSPPLPPIPMPAGGGVSSPSPFPPSPSSSPQSVTYPPSPSPSPQSSYSPSIMNDPPPSPGSYGAAGSYAYGGGTGSSPSPYGSPGGMLPPPPSPQPPPSPPPDVVTTVVALVIAVPSFAPLRPTFTQSIARALSMHLWDVAIARIVSSDEGTVTALVQITERYGPSCETTWHSSIVATCGPKLALISQALASGECQPPPPPPPQPTPPPWSKSPPPSPNFYGSYAYGGGMRGSGISSGGANMIGPVPPPSTFSGGPSALPGGQGSIDGGKRRLMSSSPTPIPPPPPASICADPDVAWCLDKPIMPNSTGSLAHCFPLSYNASQLPIATGGPQHLISMPLNVLSSWLSTPSLNVSVVNASIPCGDGICDHFEKMQAYDHTAFQRNPWDAKFAAICYADCGCGDGYCDQSGWLGSLAGTQRRMTAFAAETAQSCPRDCACGDGICSPESGESIRSCPQVRHADQPTALSPSLLVLFSSPPPVFTCVACLALLAFLVRAGLHVWQRHLRRLLHGGGARVFQAGQVEGGRDPSAL